MKNNIKVICGTIAGFILGGITVVGANQAIQAIQNTNIKVSLNGLVQEFKDETTGEIQYPITYNDRTYLPLRNVAQLSGLNVDYDTNNNMAILTDKTTVKGHFFNKTPKYSFVLSEKSSKEIWESGGYVDQYCKLYLYDDNTFYYDDGTQWDYIGKYSITDNILKLDFDAAQGYVEGPDDINPQEIDAKAVFDFSEDKLVVKSATLFKVHKVKEFVESMMIIDAEPMEMGFDCLKPGMVLESNNLNTNKNNSLDERIKPYIDYINNTDFGESPLDNACYIDSAELSKLNDGYNLHIKLYSDSEEYTEEQINEIENKLKTNNTAILDNKYTFYKNKELLLSSYNWPDAYVDLINEKYNDNNCNLFTFDNYSLGELGYSITTNKGKMFKAYGMNVAGASNYSISRKFLEEFDIPLYEDDKIVVSINESQKEHEYSVKEYFKKIENGDALVFDNIDRGVPYKFEKQLGTANAQYGGLSNAVNFIDGKIYINWFFGGV